MTDLDKPLEKLRPLVPERVKRWTQALRTDDADLRVLIARQIQDTARRMLPGSNLPLLLNLPSPGEVKGQINLGTVVYAGDRHPAGLRPGELLQHLCIVGRSGAGKTNAVFHVLAQLTERRVPWIFFDMKRTARHLLPLLDGKVTIVTPGRSLRPLSFNPFVPPAGLEPVVYRGYVVDLIARAYSLGDGSISILHKALGVLQAKGVARPTVAQILGELESTASTGRAAGWTTSARRALESLAMAGIGTSDSDGQGDLVRGMMSRSTVLELDGLNQNARDFLVPLLCLWVYLVRLGQPEREELKVVLVLEEAHHVLGGAGKHSRATVMDMILRQCREVGVGVIIVAQHPHLLSSSALGNSYATLALNLKDTPDVNRAAGVLGLKDDEKAILTSLPVGHAVVKLQDRYRKPFVVRIPQIAVRKGSVSDADLARFDRSNGPHSGHIGGFGPQRDAFERNVVSDAPLDDHALRFLQDVIDHPDDGVRARYLRLKLSGHRGNRLKARLVRDGWLQAQTVPVGTTRLVLLRVSEAGRSMLGHEPAGWGGGGIAHEYWKRWWGKRLLGQGYAVRFEAPRHAGRIDVLGTRDDRTVGVEVETGKSDAVANVRRCLRARIDRLVVAVTDRGALTAIEQVLASAGLIVPGRVMVMLVDDGQGLSWLGEREDSSSQSRTDC